MVNHVIAVLERKTITVKAGERGPIDAAVRWLKENPQKNANTVIGSVAITENGIQGSFSHTRYQNKLDTLPAIRPILENGTYLGYLNDYSGASLRNHYFAGKVHIGDEEHIVFVRVHDPDGNENTYYVHEVFTEDEIKKTEAMQTSTAIKDGQRPGNASVLYKNILSEIINANPDDVTKVIDENGAPMVVYHGTSPDDRRHENAQGGWDYYKVTSAFGPCNVFHGKITSAFPRMGEGHSTI